MKALLKPRHGSFIVAEKPPPPTLPSPLVEARDDGGRASEAGDLLAGAHATAAARNQ